MYIEKRKFFTLLAIFIPGARREGLDYSNSFLVT